MTETAEEREMWTAQFVAGASESWAVDMERYRAVAEKLGITWQEALTLQTATCLKVTVDKIIWIEQFLRDFHKEHFPERWSQEDK